MLSASGSRARASSTRQWYRVCRFLRAPNILIRPANVWLRVLAQAEPRQTAISTSGQRETELKYELPACVCRALRPIIITIKNVLFGVPGSKRRTRGAECLITTLGVAVSCFAELRLGVSWQASRKVARVTCSASYVKKNQSRSGFHKTLRFFEKRLPKDSS